MVFGSLPTPRVPLQYCFGLVVVQLVLVFTLVKVAGILPACQLIFCIYCCLRGGVVTRRCFRVLDLLNAARTSSDLFRTLTIAVCPWPSLGSSIPWFVRKPTGKCSSYVTSCHPAVKGIWCTDSKLDLKLPSASGANLARGEIK